MSLSSARAQLRAALGELKVRWERVGEHWDDRASRAFEKEHVAPYEKLGNGAMTAMDEMMDLLNRARRDCE